MFGSANDCVGLICRYVRSPGKSPECQACFAASRKLVRPNDNSGSSVTNKYGSSVIMVNRYDRSPALPSIGQERAELPSLSKMSRQLGIVPTFQLRKWHAMLAWIW